MLLVILLTMAALLALVDIFARGLFLVLGARWCRIEGARLAWALRMTAGVCFTGILVAAALIGAGVFAGRHGWLSDRWLAGLSAIPLLLLCIFYYGLPWLVIRRHLRCSPGQATGVMVLVGAPDVVLAISLALTLRFAVFEPFVVPTGAMAPTIYGAHSDVECSNCGWRYAVNMSHRLGRAAAVDREPLASSCTNCGARNDLPANSPMRTGDRILVEKASRPARWDLVVFKYPEDPRVNYVKRLVALPQEKLELVGGDVFIDGVRLSKAPDQVLDLWFLVHDTALAARRPVPGGPGWSPDGTPSPWQPAAGGWKFAGTDAPQEALAFTGEVRDRLAYNLRYQSLADYDPRSQGLPVRDVRLECFVDEFSGTGPIGFRWLFAGQRVTATISPAGNVELESAAAFEPAAAPADRPRPSKAEVARGKLSGGIAPGSKLVFAVRDGRAYVLDNGGVVASVAVGPQDVQAARDRGKERPEPCRLAIVAERCSLSLSRIVLYRDVYYRQLEEMDFPLFGEDVAAKNGTIAVGPGEYCVLGDNSRQSKDSRFWGVVQDAAIVGVARWIYWPPERWHKFR